MNYKFRKKPIVIEAFQMTFERRWNNFDWPAWLTEAWQRHEGGEGSLWCEKGEEQLFLGTLEGVYVLKFDDFIIKGIKGELYPCKPDIFEATYDVALEVES